MRTTTQYKQLTQADYVKLMQLLPRLRLDLERSGDDDGANACIMTINRVGKKAIAFIQAAERGEVVKIEKFAEGILKGREENNACVMGSACAGNGNCDNPSHNKK